MVMVIGGSGTISGLVAGGLPAGSVSANNLASSSVTQPKIATGVTSTGPAFSAYQFTQQTGITNTTNTKVNLDLEIFDTNSNFASSRFTPTIAGYYQFNGAVAVPSTSNNLGLCALLFKNGSGHAAGSSGLGSVGQLYASSTVSDLIYLNGSSDYVELYVYGAQSGSYSLVNSKYQTYFSGFLARAA